MPLRPRFLICLIPPRCLTRTPSSLLVRACFVPSPSDLSRFDRSHREDIDLQLASNPFDVNILECIMFNTLSCVIQLQWTAVNTCRPRLLSSRAGAKKLSAKSVLCFPERATAESEVQQRNTHCCFLTLSAGVVAVASTANPTGL